MGFEALVAGGKAPGSMATKLAQKLSIPLLVVKPDAEARVAAVAAGTTSPAAGGGGGGAASGVGGGFRVMFGVSPGLACLELVSFAGLLLRAGRDALVLGRCAASPAAEARAARLVASLEVREAPSIERRWSLDNTPRCAVAHAAATRFDGNVTHGHVTVASSAKASEPRLFVLCRTHSACARRGWP